LRQDARVLVDAAAYVDGRRLPGSLTLDDAWRFSEREDLPEGAFVWLGLRMPTESELGTAQRMFDLHELAVEDALGAHVRPKLEFYDDLLFLVLRTARYNSPLEQLTLGEISVFVGEAFVVTVRHGQASPLTGVRAEVERRPDLMSLGPSAVVHGILDRVVSDYEPVLDELENNVREVERDVFSETRQQPTRRIYEMIREVLDLLAAIEPLLGPLDRLQGPACSSWVDEDIAPFFRDVSDSLLRSVERARNLYNLLTSILDANLTQVSVRQNEDMRRISAWVAIAAVPTMVAGIYGMNFDHMPELHSSWGYPVVLALLAVACFVMWKRFRDADWL
jgi:magnesium transporter